jgi:hypothetical protein
MPREGQLTEKPDLTPFASLWAERSPTMDMYNDVHLTKAQKQAAQHKKIEWLVGICQVTQAKQKEQSHAENRAGPKRGGHLSPNRRS